MCSPQREESEHYFATTHSLSLHQLDHSSLPFAIRWVIVGGEAPPSSFFTSLRGYFCFPLPSKWGQGSKGHIFCQGGPGMSSSSSAGICSACSSVGSMIDFFWPPPGYPSPGREASCLGTTPSPLSPSLFPVVSQFVARRRRETNFLVSSPRGGEDCLYVAAVKNGGRWICAGKPNESAKRKLFAERRNCQKSTIFSEIAPKGKRNKFSIKVLTITQCGADEAYFQNIFSQIAKK